MSAITFPHLILVAVAASWSCTARGIAERQIDLSLVSRYFAEAAALSERDGGKLWGQPLYGPMMFADPITRSIVADRADKSGLLKPQDGVFVGVLPLEHNIANTAFEYAGIRWTMVVWPPPEEQSRRGLLLMHELWHRIQADLGFPATHPANAHLDTRTGRTWVRLEWAALHEALRSTGPRRRAAIADALLFRTHRRTLIPSAAPDERSLEMHEGLANYTGAAVAGASAAERMQLAIEELKDGERKPTYVRSFAYASGPAYGLLLDDLQPGWRTFLKATDDLGDLLGKAIGFIIPVNLADAAQERAAAHGAAEIQAEEQAREQGQQARVAEMRAKLVDGPTLHLPFSRMKIQLDPDGLIPLEGSGTVYPTARIADAWGILSVTNGALIDNKWSGVCVAAPNDVNTTPLVGPGWTLDLAAGWRLAPTAREGSYRLERSP